MTATDHKLDPNVAVLQSEWTKKLLRKWARIRRKNAMIVTMHRAVK